MTTTPPNVTDLFPAPNQEQRLTYRPMEIIRATGLSQAVVYDAIYAGELRGFQPGGGKAWVVYADDLHRWLQGERANVTAAESA